MNSVKQAALEALRDYLATQLLGSTPPLTIKLIAEGEEVAVSPALGIMPRPFTFEACNGELERDTSEPDRVLMELGAFLGSVELRVYSTDAPTRELWGQRVIDAFMQREGSPGVVVVQTPPVEVRRADNTKVTTLYPALASFELSGESWADEMAFAKKRYSYTQLDAAYPAFVLREGVYDLATLQIALTESMADASPDETQTVNEDGTLSL